VASATPVGTTAPSNTPPAGATPPASSTQHGNRAHSDGGWALVPVQTRSERFTSTNPADFAEVTGFESEWKLTPLKLVLPLINEPLDGSPYEIVASGAPA